MSSEQKNLLIGLNFHTNLNYSVHQRFLISLFSILFRIHLSFVCNYFLFFLFFSYVLSLISFVSGIIIHMICTIVASVRHFKWCDSVLNNVWPMAQQIKTFVECWQNANKFSSLPTKQKAKKKEKTKNVYWKRCFSKR